MQLVDKGELSVDSTMSTVYSRLKGTNKENLLIRDVLCHNAGLTTYIPFFNNAVKREEGQEPFLTYRKTKTNTLKVYDNLYVDPNYVFRDSTISSRSGKDYIKRTPHLYIHKHYKDSILENLISSELRPKIDYAYSDLGFILLKYGIEEKTNTQIENLVDSVYYVRLGMNNTSYLPLKKFSTTRIIPSSYDNLFRKAKLQGYVHDPTAALLGGVAGHAGIFSTAEDLAKMMQMYLNGGSYGEEVFLRPATLSKFTTRNTYFKDNRRGLGFDKPEGNSRKVNPASDFMSLESFGHTGFTGTAAWCDPENELICIFLSNRTYPSEFNKKLIQTNVRTDIQDVIYKKMLKITK